MNTFRFLSVTALLICLCACSNDNEPTPPPPVSGISVIDARLNEFYDTVDEVRLLLDDTEKTMLAKTQWKENGFRLELPQEVDYKHLVAVKEHPYFGSMSINDTHARILYQPIMLYGFLSDQQRGYFQLLKTSHDYSSTDSGSYMYVDRNIYIKGEKELSQNNTKVIHAVNLNLQKGWNIVNNNTTITESGMKISITTEVSPPSEWAFLTSN